MSLPWLPDTLLAIHLLAATAWVGGMLYALVVLRPALAVLDTPARMQMHMLTLKRFFLVVWHAMPIMLLTGWGMVFAVWGGMAHVPLAVNIMQTLAIIMAGIFLWVFFGPWKRLRRAIRPGPEVLSRIRQLIAVNLVLGALTIVVSAFGNAWG